jgi:hypothetical protein
MLNFLYRFWSICRFSYWRQPTRCLVACLIHRFLLRCNSQRHLHLLQAPTFASAPTTSCCRHQHCLLHVLHRGLHHEFLPGIPLWYSFQTRHPGTLLRQRLLHRILPRFLHPGTLLRQRLLHQICLRHLCQIRHLGKLCLSLILWCNLQQ